MTAVNGRPQAGAAQDHSVGITELTELIHHLIREWHDFGYAFPPTPCSKAIPPLGERPAEAIEAGHSAVAAIDQLSRQLCRLRDQLVGELREDSDLRAARVDAMLAGRRGES